ncbi:hypothetical protein ACTQ33_02940 [Candidatus Avoscillospira sp. LCP25S3_F1]|uniref:hypothetical protein n=1 Tax=Candidatus Avoscillospira sp. LCP25S3_F1 TaxID=3438825 RepID=UPI003F8F4F9F
MYYHASRTQGIVFLEPHYSNHGQRLLYLSSRRENTLVYLSNAIEKFCNSTGYAHHGKWYTWASYGFTPDGILRLEEYYPNATWDTYKGVSGYIYSIETAHAEKLESIPYVYTLSEPVKVVTCEYIADAYDAIMDAVACGKIILERYEDMSGEKLRQIYELLREDYRNCKEHEDYRYFLKMKFPTLFPHAESAAFPDA